MTGPRLSYPKYCSDPSEMENRSIPPLSMDVLNANPSIRLLQSHVLIRHGARTPSSFRSCWDGYNEVWDCELTSFMQPHITGNMNSPQLKLEKIFDALHAPPINNELKGTCKLGQLIQKGYAQHVANGKHLRNAYFEGEQYMKLFDTAIYTEDTAFRLRGDDMQRILASAQALVKGMFDVAQDTIVPYHTGDWDNDPIYHNSKLCPRLDELKLEAETSSRYQELNTTSDAQLLTKTHEEAGSDWKGVFDCLHTQICTDRPIHTSFDDFSDDNDTSSTFNRISRHVEWSRQYILNYNNAAYAKLAMGPLWAEILESLTVTREAAVQRRQDVKARGIPVLSLYSGHDTTLMPFLATFGKDVWDGRWTPYASMVTIESYAMGHHAEKFPSDKAFRVVYNGDVLTEKICGAELCDLDILLDMVQPFAMWDRGDACNATVSEMGGSSLGEVMSCISSPAIVTVSLVAFTLTCSLLASLLTYCLLTRTSSGCRLVNKHISRHPVPSELTDSDCIDTHDNHQWDTRNSGVEMGDRKIT